MCMLYTLTIYYLSNTSYLDFKLWDVYTVTPADFTVEMHISKKMWKNFTYCHDFWKNNEVTCVMAFENLLKKEIEEIV